MSSVCEQSEGALLACRISAHKSAPTERAASPKTGGDRRTKGEPRRDREVTIDVCERDRRPSVGGGDLSVGGAVGVTMRGWGRT